MYGDRIGSCGSISDILISRILISPVFVHLESDPGLRTVKWDLNGIAAGYCLSVYGKAIPLVIKGFCRNFYRFCILTHCHIIIPGDTGTVKF